MANNLNQRVISGLVWKFGERFSAQIVTFIVSIILARLLSPNEYGSIALVTVFISIANVFVSSGTGSALIQAKDADNEDFSTIFYFNIVLSLFLYSIIFFFAPFIASFYNNDALCPVLRVLAVRIPVAGINTVQQAYVSRNMLFKRFFYATLFGTILSGIVGIIMAYNGFGIWALVGQYLTNTITDTIVLWFTVRWRPILFFSKKKLIKLLTFAWKILASGLLDTGYQQLRNLIIGKLYSSDDLAFYNKGDQYPSLVVTNVNASISSVLFPAISMYQDDKAKVKGMTRRAIKTSSFIMWPLMVGLGVIAKPLISIMLTDKWLPCVPYLQIACFTYGLWPVHTANLEALKAMGRSDMFLRLEVIKKIMGITVLICVMRMGVMAIAISSILTSIISCFINSFPNRKLLTYTYFEQIKDILPSLVISILMGMCVFLLNFANLDSFITICLQVIIGACVYIGLSLVFNKEEFLYIFGVIKKIKNHNTQMR